MFFIIVFLLKNMPNESKKKQLDRSNILIEFPADANPYETREEFDVFISYSLEKKSQAKLLYNELVVKHNFRMWFDELYSRALQPTRLAKGIANSKVFLCILTRDYLASTDCINELKYAYKLKKKIIVVFFEKLDLNSDMGEVDFIMNTSACIRYKFYRFDLNDWSSNPMFQYVVEEIQKDASQNSLFQSEPPTTSVFSSNEVIYLKIFFQY